MNVVELERVAVALDEARRTKRGYKGIGFNMFDWFTGNRAGYGLVDHVDDCESVACIAGWTCLLAGADSVVPSRAWAQAQQILGLSAVQSRALFMGRNEDESLPNKGRSTLTALEAVMCIRNLIRTGVVCWPSNLEVAYAQGWQAVGALDGTESAD